MNRMHRWLCASTPWKRSLERSLLPWVFDGVTLGDDVLEVGPGPGLTTNLLRRKVVRLTALEVDPRLAAGLKERMRGSNVTVVEGDACAMPLDDDAYSAVVSLTMLHHVPSSAQQDALLGEAYRVLRPGGWFVGSDSTWSLAFHLLHLGDTMVLVDPATLGTRLSAAGFNDVVVDRGNRRFRFRARKPESAAAPTT